jgi:hypothetical protein
VQAVEEVRRLDEGPGVLGHHIGRVAVGPLRRQADGVAIGEVETLDGQFVGGLDDAQVEGGGGAQALAIDRLHAGDPRLGGGGQLAAAFQRAVGQAGLQGGSRALVQAQGRGVFGIFPHQVFGDPGQQGLGGGVARRGGQGVAAERGGGRAEG